MGLTWSVPTKPGEGLEQETAPRFGTMRLRSIFDHSVGMWPFSLWVLWSNYASPWSFCSIGSTMILLFYTQLRDPSVPWTSLWSTCSMNTTWSTCSTGSTMVHLFCEHYHGPPVPWASPYSTCSMNITMVHLFHEHCHGPSVLWLSLWSTCFMGITVFMM